MIEKAVPFLDKLTKEQRAEFYAGLHDAVYQAGQLIHIGSGDCVGLLYVEHGAIRVYITSEEGREITLFRIEDGDVCVLSASCVLEAVDFEVNIEAISQTKVKFLDVATFSRLTSENVYAELFSYKVATERFSDVMWAMQQILFTSFDCRLASFLLQECKKGETDTLSLTHEQIAKYLGSAREVVSRMLKYFEKEGYVSLAKGKVTLVQPEELEKYKVQSTTISQKQPFSTFLRTHRW